MSLDLFTERLVKTGAFEAAQQPSECDKQLLGAIFDALVACDLTVAFMHADESVVPRQLNETSDPAWSRAAAQAYLTCGGGALSATELFAFVERVAQLRMQPFGAVFAAALVQAAELGGWPETLALLSGVPTDKVAAVLADWNECRPREEVELLRSALESELTYAEAPGAAEIDRTHDCTFVRQQ